MMTQNQASATVKGTVIEVNTEGILVFLDDGRKGFVPNDEISLDRRVSVARKKIAPGDTLQLAVVPDGNNHVRLKLSLRAVNDPWQTSAVNKKYAVDQIVYGEVVNVRNFAVFVQVEPGIDAIVWPEGVPLLKNQSIDELIVVGDQLVGKITHLSYGSRKMEINPIMYLKDLGALGFADQANILWSALGIDDNLNRGQATNDKDTSELSAPVIGKDDFVRQLGMQALAQQPLPVVLSRILTWLCYKTGSSIGLIIEVNHSSRSVSIHASYPELTKQQITLLQDGLYYSPAVEVTGGDEVVDNDTDVVTGDRYVNFFPTLNYQSWLGVPIEIAGQEPRFALILMDEEPLAFNERNEQGRRIIDLARTSSYFVGTAIQQAALFDYMQRYEERYGMGQLIGDMIHETNHEVDKFSLSLGALKTHLQDFSSDAASNHLEEWRKQMDTYVKNLENCYTELAEITDSYKRQAEAKFEPVDINLTVKQVMRQLRYTSKNMGITFYTKLDPDLPPAYGIGTHIRQIIYNLALNAMQMIVLQREKIREYCSIIGQAERIQQPSVIVIGTYYHSSDADRPIEVRVSDSGPGIHYHNQQRLFQSAFSERKHGEGRGLSISRNLAERMGGKLRLHNSILFFGSAFSFRMIPYSDSNKLEGQNG